VSKVIVYLFVITLVQANFEVFICYSNEEQAGIKTIYEGSMVTVIYFITTMWLVLYGSIWVNKRNRWFIFFAILAKFLSILMFSATVNVNNSIEAKK